MGEYSGLALFLIGVPVLMWLLLALRRGPAEGLTTRKITPINTIQKGQ